MKTINLTNEQYKHMVN